MTLRVDVLKEKFEEIQLPDICPVCGKKNPGSTINMRTYISVNQPLKEKIGEHWNLDFPVCQNHKKNIRIGRYVSMVLFLLMVMVSMVFFYAIWLMIGTQHWFIYSLIGISLIATGIYTISKIYSAPILLESFSYRLLFTFRDDDLAKCFAKLNGINEVHTTMNQTIKLENK